MKKLFCILSVLTLLFSLSSCKNNNSKNFKQETTRTNISDDSVDEFLSILGGEPMPAEYIGGFKDDRNPCYNITSPQIAAETDMKIFKASMTSYSFVMLDSKVYVLSVAPGGYGFVNAVPCDFDNDGNKDLLFAYSWGSGIHRSEIAVFNSVSKEITVLYNTIDTDNPDVDLVVGAVVSVSPDSDNPEITYPVYSADIEIHNENFADLSYTTTGLVGTIELINGTPAFIPS